MNVTFVPGDVPELTEPVLQTIAAAGVALNWEHPSPQDIEAVAASGAKALTIMSNNCGNQGRGLAILLQQRQVARVCRRGHLLDHLLEDGLRDGGRAGEATWSKERVFTCRHQARASRPKRCGRT